MAEPDDLVLTLLREMRREMNARFEAVDARFDRVDTKLAEHDKRFKSISQALHGEPLLGQYATAELDERIGALEKRLVAIEERQ